MEDITDADYTHIYELERVHFLPGPRLEWSKAIKKTKVKLDLLTDIART